MSATTEYKDQKIGCQFFASIAVAKGIKITVPPESDLFRPNPLYGVCQNSHEWIKYTAKVREHNAAKAQAQQALEDAKLLDAFWKGAKEVNDYYSMTWAGDMNSGDYTSPPLIPALKGLYEKQKI